MHQNKANIGDTIRSYDFKPMSDRGDCYIEGIVIEKTASSFKVAVQNRVFDGDKVEVEVGERVETPFRLIFGDWEARIV
jgi:hypothetical protein